MPFKLRSTTEASEQLEELDATDAKKARKIRKALAYLQASQRHPSLHTHKYETLSKTAGYEVFEAYAENRTPGAYRIFIRYGPDRQEITILAITPRP